jgi:hypothetical protein
MVGYKITRRRLMATEKEIMEETLAGICKSLEEPIKDYGHIKNERTRSYLENLERERIAKLEVSKRWFEKHLSMSDEEKKAYEEEQRRESDWAWRHRPYDGEER